MMTMIYVVLDKIYDTAGFYYTVELDKHETQWYILIQSILLW